MKGVHSTAVKGGYAPRNDLQTGMSVSAVFRKFSASRPTIKRAQDEGPRSVPS
jgi:hypothetical protein